MKKFVLKLSLFFIPIIIFAFVTEVAVTSTLKTSRKNYHAVWNDLFDGKINSEIIIMGASRAKININPKIIEDSTGLSTYNLGINGYNFSMDYFRYRLLMKYNKHPKLIILSLGYITLDKRNNLFMIEQFLPFTFDKDLYNETKTYEGLNFYDYNFPFVRYIGKAKLMKHAANIIFNPSSNYELRYKGYARQCVNWNNDLSKVLGNNKNRIKPNQKVDSTTISLFDKFLKELKKENIDIVLVYSPEYIQGQEVYGNRSQIISLYQKFADKYNIPFWDYSKDEISYHKHYFYNANHLNCVGSDAFTKKLYKKLISSYSFLHTP